MVNFGEQVVGVAWFLDDYGGQGFPLLRIPFQVESHSEDVS